MPYTSMPAVAAASTDAEVDGARRSTSRPSTRASRTPRRRPKPIDAAGRRRPPRRRRSRRARSSTLARLRALPRRGGPRRGPLGPDAEGRPGPPDPRRRPDRALDVPRRPAARGHLPHLQHRPQRHADAVVLRLGEPRPTAGRSPTTSTRSATATRPATRRSSWRGPLDEDIDLAQGRGALRRRRRARASRWSARSWSPGRAFAPAATAVEVRAVYDSAADRVPGPLARHPRRHRGDERADARGAARGRGARGPGGGGRGRRARRTSGARTPWLRREARAEVRLAGRWRLLGRVGRGRSGGRPRPAPSSRTRSPSSCPPQLPRASRSRTSSSATRQSPSTSGSSTSPRRGVRQFVGRGSDEPHGRSRASEVEARGRYDGRRVVRRASRGSLRSTERACPSPRASTSRSRSRSGTARARERGNRRGLTQWFYVYLPPREKPSVVGPMLAAALGVLALELVVVAALRRKRVPAAAA